MAYKFIITLFIIVNYLNLSVCYQVKDGPLLTYRRMYENNY